MVTLELIWDCEAQEATCWYNEREPHQGEERASSGPKKGIVESQTGQCVQSQFTEQGVKDCKVQLLSWIQGEDASTLRAGEWHNLIYVSESEFAESFTFFLQKVVVKEGQEGLVQVEERCDSSFD